MSKRAVFTTKQNAALRGALEGLGFPSQQAAAEALGIEQQNVSRLVSDDRAGFSYVTGTRVAQLAGFDGVDAFFAERGVSNPPASAPDSATSLSDNDVIRDAG